MSASLAILAAILLPLIGAALLSTQGDNPNKREGITILTTIATFLCVLTLLPEVLDGHRPGVELIELFPGISLAFRVEPLGMLFALIASGLWIVTSLYAIGYMRGHHEINQTRFFVCFAVAISAALAVAFSRNLLTLFAAYEVLSLSTYPLVTHHGTEAAKRAGRVYLGILMTTSILFLLLAIIWTYHLAGTLEFTPGGILAGHVSGTTVGVLLGLFVFGAGKAALMPFHRWLPAAMVAPTPVSALLHAVAVVKVGVFTVLKVVIYIFGLDLLTSTGMSIWLMYVAAFTIIAASVVAIYKDNLKARLAYSTISQLSYIVLGAALANTWGVIGGGMHIAMHAMGKITLFFCAGALIVVAHKTEVSTMQGLGRKMPWTFAAFGVGAMSIIGLPFVGGVWSKWYLALGAAEAHQIPLILVLLVSSLLSIVYLVPVVAQAFFKEAPAHGHDHPGDAHHGSDENDGENLERKHILCVLPPCITAVGCILLFFYSDALYTLLAPIAGG